MWQRVCSGSHQAQANQCPMLTILFSVIGCSNQGALEPQEGSREAWAKEKLVLGSPSLATASTFDISPNSSPYLPDAGSDRGFQRREMSCLDPVLLASLPHSPHLHSRPLASLLPLLDLPARSLSGILLHSAEIHCRHKNEKTASGGLSGLLVSVHPWRGPI